MDMAAHKKSSKEATAASNMLPRLPHERTVEECAGSAVGQLSRSLERIACMSMVRDSTRSGSLLLAAKLGTPPGHVLISQLSIAELRISYALGADINALGLERGQIP